MEPESACEHRRNRLLSAGPLPAAAAPGVRRAHHVLASRVLALVAEHR